MLETHFNARNIAYFFLRQDTVLAIVLRKEVVAEVGIGKIRLVDGYVTCPCGYSQQGEDCCKDVI